jgi:pimeloyl-ACP methyl ester carboxylesterase
MTLGSRWRRSIKITAAILLAAWVFTCQFLMQDRLSDEIIKNNFEKKGLSLFTKGLLIDKHRLHYAQVGSDTLATLLFIHGSPGSLSNFINYMQDTQLIRKYRMVSVDRPGFGYSDFGNTTNIEKQAAYLSVLIDSLDNKKPFYLIGHSLAGAVIIKLAAMKPGEVSGLVMLAGSVDPSLEGNGFWRPLITYSPARWLVPAAFRYSNEEQWWLKKDLVKLKTDFSKVKCPVYIFHGDVDENVPVANADYAKKMLANARKVELTVFNGQQHFIVWTKFKEIKKRLIDLTHES